ncbi:MAG: hypothetical protein EOP48_13405 [Sphingobacteriales bacterium]|nr:MAG: hypothetical protein EOP48_13405 [Sphingobacteriales bacterium]
MKNAQKQSDPKIPKKNEGYEDGNTKKIVNEQDQQAISNKDESEADKSEISSVDKPLMNEDTSEQKDGGTPESIEADKKKDAGVNP